MGNFCFGMKNSSKGLVHPVAGHDGVTMAALPEEATIRVRVKVRMTKRQLRDLMANTDVNKGTSELGSLIMEEYLKGKLQARVDTNGLESTFKNAKGWSLSPIQEVSEEEHS